MVDTTPLSGRFFYGLQGCWWTPDRLYRIYVSPTMISGAYVAGQLYDQEAAELQLQGIGSLLFKSYVDRKLAQRVERELLYDGLDPFSKPFLDQDPRNFQIERCEVLATRVDRRRSWWTPFNVGVVDIRLFDNTRRRFILIGEGPPDATIELLKAFDDRTEVKGTYKPSAQAKAKAEAKSLTPRERRRQLVILSVVWALFFGTLSALFVVARSPLRICLTWIVYTVASTAFFLWLAYAVGKVPAEIDRSDLQ